MQLYDHPDCPYGMKVRIALAETECDYETVRVDLAAGQQHSAEFLKINPFGQVPVLIDDSLVLYDSTIINEYLNEWYASEPGLLPDLEHAPERARVRLLEDFADRAFTPAVMALEAEQAKPEGERNGERVSALIETIEKALPMLERVLSEQQFLGPNFSLADIAFAPAALRLERLGVDPGEAHKNVKDWLTRLAGRPSIMTVLEMAA